MRLQQRGGFGDIPVEHRLHDRRVLVGTGSGAAQSAAPRQMTIAVGGVEQLRVHVDEVGRSARRYQTAMEGAVCGFPGRIEFEFVEVPRRVTRDAGKPMEGDHDALLPKGVAVLDTFAQTNLGQQAAGPRQLEQILFADGCGEESAKIGLADEPVPGGAVERLPQGIEPYAIARTQLPHPELLSGQNRGRDHVVPEPCIDGASLGFPALADLDLIRKWHDLACFDSSFVFSCNLIHYLVYKFKLCIKLKTNLGVIAC